MKSIVIYNSQTGFTKRYAEWISEAAACECVEFKQAAKLNLADYDAIVFGSWCMAGNIAKLPWFKKQMPALAAAGKKLIVYAVGGSPEENPDVTAAINKIFTDEEINQEGFNEEEVPEIVEEVEEKIDINLNSNVINNEEKEINTHQDMTICVAMAFTHAKHEI